MRRAVPSNAPIGAMNLRMIAASNQSAAPIPISMFALNTQASKSMIPILQSSIIPQIQSIANGTWSGYIDFSQQYRTNSIPAFLAAGSGTIANVSNVTVPNSTSNVYGAFQAENINFAKNLVNDFSVTEDTILPITGKLINTDAYKNSDVGIYAKTTNVNGVNSSTWSTTVKGLKSFSFAFSPVTQPIQNDWIIQPSETGKEIGFAFWPFSTYYLTSGYSWFKQFFPGGNDMIVTVRAIGWSAASVKIRIVDPTTSVSSAVALANRETIRTTNGTVSNRDMSRTPETATPALFVNGGITK